MGGQAATWLERCCAVILVTLLLGFCQVYEVPSFLWSRNGRDAFSLQAARVSIGSPERVEPRPRSNDPSALSETVQGGGDGGNSHVGAHGGQRSGPNSVGDASSTPAATATTTTTTRPYQAAVFAAIAPVLSGGRTQNLLLNALMMKCSADCLGSKLPFHMIWGGAEEEKASFLPILKKFGWIIEDHSQDAVYIRSLHKPVFDDEEAARQRRWWAHLGDNGVRSRKDGWASYFRFFAWKAQQYDRVIVSDVDVIFTDNPGPYLANLSLSANQPFLASLERKTNKQDSDGIFMYEFSGINAHIMAIVPSQAIFDELVLRARKGEYMPLRNNDEDVLDSVFPPRQVTVQGFDKKTGMRSDMSSVIPHAHFPQASCPSKPPKGKENWKPTTCGDLIRYCNLTKSSIRLQWEALVERCA